MSAQARHLDQTARMLWLTLRRERRAMTVAQVTYHWRPTFSASEVQDALDRLLANGCLERIRGEHAASYVATEKVLPALELAALSRRAGPPQARLIPPGDRPMYSSGEGLS